MLRKSNSQRIVISFIFACLTATAAFAQGSGFNFQGRLNDGANPANGRYDLQFRLYNAVTGGAQIGAEVSRPNTILINGVFSTTLDFGAAAFNNPNNIFVEIGVRLAGSPNPYTILGPRQQITVVPFAMRAANATNADNATNAQNSVNAQNAVNATNAVNAQNATNATNATTASTATNALSLGGVAPSGWARLNVSNTGDLLTTGKLQITGNATQSSTSNGLVKAMLTVLASSPPTIVRCYNGITNSSNGNCGFTVSQPLNGVFRIDFGFPVDDRFVSVSAEYNNGTFNPHTNNNGINYRLFNTTTVEVFTFTRNFEDTEGSINFTIIMF